LSGRRDCSCDKFDRLEGASVGAYASAFLEELGRDDAEKRNLYRCRVCGTLWEKRAPDVEAKAARPSLVKVGKQ
jgi:hypothetical protein